ncbi:MAG: glycogen synthase GlgA [Spirochaetales bacterium]
MKILMVTAEAVPFAKTGGLADAVSALAIALAKNGHDVKIIMPRYYSISRDNLQLLEGPMGIPCGYTEEWTAVYSTVMPNTEKNPLSVYFVDHEKAFGRDGIYGTVTESDFADNPYRFSILCHSAFQLCRKLNWYPDIIHSHDWSAALTSVLLRFNQRFDAFAHTACVFTVHNLGYQGVYSKHNYPVMGIAWDHFYSAGFEDHDRINLLKAGLISSDMITTVSPTYANEIQSPEYGFGLDAVLRHRNADVYGILNGVDTDVWNPAKDKKIESTYTAKTLEKKLKNKCALQKKMGLEENPDVPLIGIITRLADQKGIAELFAPTFGTAFNMCRDMKIQLAILGSGETWCEHEIQALQEKTPNLRAYIGYDDALSHLIEAGSDFFLMPSRYEPCGLNQMYSLLYGTLPIVRRTGGLADSVQNYDETSGGGTGFMFNNLTPQSIYDTVGWATYAWYNKKEHIEAMRIRAMKQKFGWDESAKKYIGVYENALKKQGISTN